MNELLFLLLIACQQDNCLVFNNEFGLNIITHNKTIAQQKHIINDKTVWIWHYSQRVHQPTVYYRT